MLTHSSLNNKNNRQLRRLFNRVNKLRNSNMDKQKLKQTQYINNSSL